MKLKLKILHDASHLSKFIKNDQLSCANYVHSIVKEELDNKLVTKNLYVINNKEIEPVIQVF